MISYEEYKKLRQTPWDELSEEDQKRRLDEFTRRLEVTEKFLMSRVSKERMPENIENELPDDDPKKEILSYMRIMHNEEGGQA